ncbi:MAG TPA: phosphotriesterase [Solirubrobacteraceae bacterium]|nr:phosphotriesterase [Solirubrobacteraceae bacterium]
MPIHTVLGLIEPDELGPTSMHEHCLVDATVWVSPPREPMPADERVRIENLGFVHWNFDSLADNLRLDDTELAAHEVGRLAGVQGAAIVDLTPGWGLGPRRTAELPEISRRAGVHIIAGCGLYVHDAHPEWAESASVEQLTEMLIGELRDGVDDTGVRPGIIGEIGTSDPPTPREMRVLSAAGRAGAATGCAVNIHVDPFGRHALAVIDALLAEGMSVERIVISHLDSYLALDHDYHRAIAATGAVLEFDNFGLEHYTTQPGRGLLRNRTDLERIEALAGLLDDGLAGQIVLGVDVYTKAQLRRYGGSGYKHILTHIAPALTEYFGATQEQIDQMLVHTPRRVLDRPVL